MHLKTCGLFNCDLQLKGNLISMLGKGPATESDEFLEKFQRGGGHFQGMIFQQLYWEK